jgi:hypothetical protein
MSTLWRFRGELIGWVALLLLAGIVVWYVP